MSLPFPRIRLTVIGTGYLGLTHAVCMAELGHEVLAMDVNPTKVAKAARGQPPFFEGCLSAGRRASSSAAPRRNGRRAVRWAAQQPETLGHNGSNCCIAWADPGRQLVFVYLTDRLTAGHEGARHQGEVADAIIAACT